MRAAASFLSYPRPFCHPRHVSPPPEFLFSSEESRKLSILRIHLDTELPLFAPQRLLEGFSSAPAQYIVPGRVFGPWRVWREVSSDRDHNTQQRPLWFAQAGVSMLTHKRHHSGKRRAELLRGSIRKKKQYETQAILAGWKEGSLVDE